MSTNPTASGSEIPAPFSFKYQKLLDFNAEQARFAACYDDFFILNSLEMPFEAFAIPTLACWKSALTLAHHVHSPKIPLTLGSFAVVTGMSPTTFCGLLQHRTMKDFPVFVVSSIGLAPWTRDSCILKLFSGTPRDDGAALFYVEASFTGVAHWTFGRQVVVAPVLTVPSPPPPPALVPNRLSFVVYSDVPQPLTGDNVFWRAKVTPQNLEEFSQCSMRMLACSCDWGVVCEHEAGFVATSLNIVHRVFLGVDSMAPDAWSATVTSSCDGPYQVLRSGLRSKLLLPFGRSMFTPATSYLSIPSENYTYGTNSTICQSILRWLNVDELQPYRDRRTFKIGVWEVSALYYDTQTSTTHSLVQGVKSMFNFGFTETNPLAQRGLVPVIAESAQEIFTVKRLYPVLDRLSIGEYTLKLPSIQEAMGKLALKDAHDITPAYVRDQLRLLSAKNKWEVEFDADVVSDWIAQVSRTATTQGFAMATPANNVCWTCLRQVQTRWHICRNCRSAMRHNPPYSLPEFISHVGFVPLWSKHFEPPVFTLKPDVVITFNRTVIEADFAPHYVLARAAVREALLTQRGQLCGPMFMGLIPTTFPLCAEMSLLAFCIRLGVARLFEAKEYVYDAAYHFACLFIVKVLEPETVEYFLSHHTGPKLIKMLTAQSDLNNGETLQIRHPRRPGLSADFSGFVKSEKSHSCEYVDSNLVLKPTEKPRLIVAPDAKHLFKLGPYTHVQTKWLAAHFNWERALFYAGCSTPGILNKWINRSLSKIPHAISWGGDISAIDSNYGKQTFAFIRKVRKLQFPFLPAEIEDLFDAEEQLRVRFGRSPYRAYVSDVHSSGVSDTSYKNSLISLFLSLVAFLHGAFDYLNNPSCVTDEMVHLLLEQVDFAISGDDSLVRSPRRVFGVDVTSELFRARYCFAWAEAGFSVKLQMYNEADWRLATFLGARPVWDSTQYSWAPEPARRLRSMYWQLDCSIHPISWARGVSQQTIRASSHAPVIADIAQWYLDITSGATAGFAYNPYNPMSQETSIGGITQRAIDEFLQDYHVTVEEYNDFRLALSTVRDPLANFSMSIFHRILQME
jgi:hypothetical protein